GARTRVRFRCRGSLLRGRLCRRRCRAWGRGTTRLGSGGSRGCNCRDKRGGRRRGRPDGAARDGTGSRKGRLRDCGTLVARLGGAPVLRLGLLAPLVCTVDGVTLLGGAPVLRRLFLVFFRGGRLLYDRGTLAGVISRFPASRRLFPAFYRGGRRWRFVYLGR